MATRTYARPTPPHLGSLAEALNPVLPRFYAYYDKGTLYVSSDDFSQETDDLVSALIAAAPAESPQLDAKYAVDRLSTLEKAIALTLLDAINLERQTSGRQPVTPAQFVNAVKAKVDTL